LARSFTLVRRRARYLHAGPHAGAKPEVHFRYRNAADCSSSSKHAFILSDETEILVYLDTGAALGLIKRCHGSRVFLASTTMLASCRSNSAVSVPYHHVYHPVTCQSYMYLSVDRTKYDMSGTRLTQHERRDGPTLRVVYSTVQ